MKSVILSCALLGVYAQLCFGIDSNNQSPPYEQGLLPAGISDDAPSSAVSAGMPSPDPAIAQAPTPQAVAAATVSLGPLPGMENLAHQQNAATPDAPPALSQGAPMLAAGKKEAAPSPGESAFQGSPGTTALLLSPPAAGVHVSLTDDDGHPAKVAHLRIIGNQAFSGRALVRLFSVRPAGLLGRLKGAENYTPDTLQEDLERLRMFYLDHGYVDFRVTGTKVTPAHDRQGVDITVSLSEGLPYRISDIHVAGGLPTDPSAPMAILQRASDHAALTEAQLDHLLTLHSGDAFSRQRLADSVQRIGDALGRNGYAAAQVVPQVQVDRDKRTVALAVQVTPGTRTYVRRINIRGNIVTHEAVIRRELRQMEAAWYDSVAIRQSRERLERLGYFSSVKIDPVPVPDAPDQVDLDVAVTEKPTSHLSFGAGYSTIDRFFANAGVSFPNLAGTGNRAALNYFIGSVNRDLSFSYTNPYLTPDGVSRGFDLYNRRFDTKNLPGVAPFVTSTTGAAVRYGIPLGAQTSATLGAGVENTRIGLYDGSPARFMQFVQQHGPSNTVAPLTAGLMRDTRDNPMFPTRGTLNNITAELGVGNLDYYKVTYQGQLARPITDNSTLLLNLNLGYAGGQLPFYKNFYAGGPGTVRGFAWGSIGPKDPVDQVALGGTRLATASAEYFFPVPGLADQNLKLSVFTDAGNVWGGDGADDGSAFARWRLAAGLGLTWQSPVGPLKLSVAAPFKKQPSDTTQILQLTFGTAF